MCWFSPYQCCILQDSVSFYGKCSYSQLLRIQRYKGNNSSWQHDISMSDSPVVPAGVISLKCSNTSSLFESLAALAKQRINCLVSGPGSSREAWSGCRVSCSWRTTCLASDDWHKRDSWILQGRAIALLPMNEGWFTKLRSQYWLFRRKLSSFIVTLLRVPSWHTAHKRYLASLVLFRHVIPLERPESLRNIDWKLRKLSWRYEHVPSLTNAYYTNRNVEYIFEGWPIQFNGSVIQEALDLHNS